MADKMAMGVQLELRVEAWVKRQLGTTKTVRRYQATGHPVKRPHEVDVWAHFKGGFLRSDTDLWIECKDRKSSIKRRDISELVSKPKSVYRACALKGERLYFDRLMFVSTSNFDSDAIIVADEEGVACVLYDGKTYELQTKGTWQDKPKWLMDVEATA